VACVYDGVHVKVLVDGLNVAPAGNMAAEYVNESPSASVAEIANDRFDPSLTYLEPMVVSTGGLFVVTIGEVATDTELDDGEIFPAPSYALIV
jgi:hypothetical protein